MPLILASGGLALPGGGVFTSDQFAILRDLNIIALGSIGTQTSSETSSVEPFEKLGPDFGQLLYFQTISGVGPNLISSLVKATQDVIIYGVDAASTASLGGVTGLGDTSMDSSGTITIQYDTSSCAGRGAFVFDTSSPPKKILDPPFIILAHELAHALHFINGTINQNTPETKAESLAIGVENQIRSEASAVYQKMTGQSVDLSQRDPNNHGGGCNAPGGPPQNPWEINCFIATAAYGSPYAHEVQALRHFRDTYLRDTVLGNLFFARFYTEYYLYSPIVAWAMEESSELTETIRTVLVDPIFEFMRVLEWYFVNDERGHEFARYVDEVLCRTNIRTDDQFAITVIHALERAKTVLSRCERVPQMNWPIRPPVAADPASTIDYLCRVITARTEDRRFSLWVLIEPLLLHWSAAASCARDASRQDVADGYCQGIVSWLRLLPSLASFATLPTTELIHELSCLKEIIFRSEDSRHQLGQFLLRELSVDASYDVAQVLEQAGYL
jgi:hypothetical protein